MPIVGAPPPDRFTTPEIPTPAPGDDDNDFDCVFGGDAVIPNLPGDGPDDYGRAPPNDVGFL